MSNEEKKVLFNALNQILINQQKIIDGLRIDYDPYYTDSAIYETAKIKSNSYFKFLDEEGEQNYE